MLKKLTLTALAASTLLVGSSITASADSDVNYDHLLSAGTNNAYLAMEDGSSFYATGSNANGKLGVGDGGGNNKTSPMQADVSDIAMIDAGDSHSTLLKKDGTIWSWGFASYGELGTGNKRDTARVPVKNKYIDNVKEVRAGGQFTLALKNDGTVWAYGENNFGQLGIGTKGVSAFSVKPVQVQGLEDIIAIDAGDSFGAALDKNNQLWVWGRGYDGALGQDDKENQLTPVQYRIDDIKTFTAGADRIYVLTNSGEVYASGSNTSGKLGDGTSTFRRSPVLINISDVNRLKAGKTQTFALKNDGTLWGWGTNNEGQVGDGTDVFSIKVPTQVVDEMNTPLTDVVAFSAAGTHSHALTADGTVWSWGFNRNGELGIGNTKQQNAATKTNFPNPFSK
ncbi:copper amine oxidase [Paenibacillus sp. CMAA1739]|uniref:RCC1 domain-containing protein n=1 Tax=Paenibacillus ottowii TaxID=2315729 RepID=UPI002730AC05|nr:MULTISPECIES: copper amine oxidase [Paenibacillus]MDP1510599.1 copper amine oxidase [Paenibacillus ottowii]MEC4566015.1 copper amine oxidase [Paenibacillus sp. CMAA1739]